jgi:hypothetical protein
MHDPASDSNSDEIEEVEVIPPPKRKRKPTPKIPMSRASQMGGSSHAAPRRSHQRAAQPQDVPQESVPNLDDYPPGSTSYTDRSTLGSTSVMLE